MARKLSKDFESNPRTEIQTRLAQWYGKRHNHEGNVGGWIFRTEPREIEAWEWDDPEAARVWQLDETGTVPEPTGHHVKRIVRVSKGRPIAQGWYSYYHVMRDAIRRELEAL